MYYLLYLLDKRLKINDYHLRVLAVHTHEVLKLVYFLLVDCWEILTLPSILLFAWVIPLSSKKCLYYWVNLRVNLGCWKGWLILWHNTKTICITIAWLLKVYNPRRPCLYSPRVFIECISTLIYYYDRSHKSSLLTKLCYIHLVVVRSEIISRKSEWHVIVFMENYILVAIGLTSIPIIGRVSIND